MQLWWGITSTVKKSMLKVWTEGWVVEGTLGPEQWAAETFFLKRLHAGHSDGDSKDTICFVSFITFSLAMKLETLFLRTKSFCIKLQDFNLSWVRQTVMCFPAVLLVDNGLNCGSAPVQMALSGSFLRTQEIHRANALIIGQKLSHFPASWGQVADAALHTVRLGAKYSKARPYKVLLSFAIQPLNDNNIQCAYMDLGILVMIIFRIPRCWTV